MSDDAIIDIHTHLNRTAEIGRMAMSTVNTGSSWTGTLEEHLTTMRQCGIGRAVVLVVMPTHEMRDKVLRERGPYGSEGWAESAGLALDERLLQRLDRNNVWGCAMGQEHPELLPFINVDPDLLAGDACANYVRNRVLEGARGVKLLPMSHCFHGNDRRLWPMYEYLEHVGLPVLSQSGDGGDISPLTGDHWGRPRYFGEVAEAFPKLNLILAHFGTGYLADVLDLARRYDNVHFDTSVVTSRIGSAPGWSRPETAALFRRVGVRHIVFGSNFPLFERQPDIDALRGLDLTEEERRLIFHDNAARILDHARLPLGS